MADIQSQLIVNNLAYDMNECDCFRRLKTCSHATKVGSNVDSIMVESRGEQLISRLFGLYQTS